MKNKVVYDLVSMENMPMVLITDCPTDLQERLTNLIQESEKIESTINMDKSKSKQRNQIVPIQLEDPSIEHVDKYVLGTRDDNR